MKFPTVLTNLTLTLAVTCLTVLTACGQKPLTPLDSIPASAGSPPVQNINREIIIVMPVPDHSHNAGRNPADPKNMEVSPCS